MYLNETETQTLFERYKWKLLFVPTIGQSNLTKKYNILIKTFKEQKHNSLQAGKRLCKRYPIWILIHEIKSEPVDDSNGV